MHCRRFLPHSLTRRDMLLRCANGFGAVALSALLAEEGAYASILAGPDSKETMFRTGAAFRYGTTASAPGGPWPLTCLNFALRNSGQAETAVIDAVGRSIPELDNHGAGPGASRGLAHCGQTKMRVPILLSGIGNFVWHFEQVNSISVMAVMRKGISRPGSA